MMRIVSRLALAAGLLLAIGVGATATATPANSARVATSEASSSDIGAAGACYDNKRYFVTKNGYRDLPTGDGYWKTTSNCGDINLYLNNGGRYVKVHMYASKPTVKPWCGEANYTWAPNQTWKVIKSGVPTGWYFFICFKTTDTASGYAAY